MEHDNKERGAYKEKYINCVSVFIPYSYRTFIVLRDIRIMNWPMTQKTADPAPANEKRGNEHNPTAAYCCAKLNSRPKRNTHVPKS